MSGHAVDFDDGGEQLATAPPARGASRDSSASRREASEISVISRSMRLTSPRTMSQQPRAALIVLGAAEHLHRAGQRGEGVFQLMRHIGGEAFDGVDAVIEARRSWISGCRPDRRSRQSRSGKIGNVAAPANARAHPVGRRRQPLRPARRWCPPDRAKRTASPANATRKTWIRVARSGAQDIVDVAAFGGEQQHAIDGGESAGSGSATDRTSRLRSSTRSAVPVCPVSAVLDFRDRRARLAPPS